eukprot:scaffold2875_cov247-Pinguiococcus_pyrenoidosus.AAC.18
MDGPTLKDGTSARSLPLAGSLTSKVRPVRLSIHSPSTYARCSVGTWRLRLRARLETGRRRRKKSRLCMTTQTSPEPDCKASETAPNWSWGWTQEKRYDESFVGFGVFFVLLGFSLAPPNPRTDGQILKEKTRSLGTA